VEIHQLRAFVAIADTGSFCRAAQKCHVAQPSLSKSIQKLEIELGATLFHRSKRRTALTQDGNLLLARACRIVNDVDAAKRDFAATNNPRPCTVSVGALPTISPYLLPRVIIQFNQRFAKLKVTVTEKVTADLLEMIDSYELDLALASLPIPERNYDRETLFREELLLAVPFKHPLAVQQKVGIRDLEREQFILLKDVHCLADQVLSFCQKNNAHLKIVLEASQIETIQLFVMAGLGISLVPQMARLDGQTALVYRSLEEPKPTRSIAAIWRKGREHTRATLEFLTQLRQTAKVSRLHQTESILEPHGAPPSPGAK
jgi:LysR family transcriptional regulator, hydrogen peroxide-inducible genes activator